MSEQNLRIALIAEGATDLIVIEAALNAILERPFVLTQLQPEPTRPELGGGWGGVLKWSRETAQRYSGCLDDEPMLGTFDLLIIHLDVDVAGFHYSQLGASIVELADAGVIDHLPCAMPCPPLSDTVDALQQVLLSWLSPVTPGARTVLCLPAQSSGTWLAAALLPDANKLLVGAECNTAVEDGLARLPKAQRVKKAQRDYRDHADAISEQWQKVKTVCTQARDFEISVLSRM